MVFFFYSYCSNAQKRIEKQTPTADQSHFHLFGTSFILQEFPRETDLRLGGIAPVFTEIKERVQEVPAVPQVLSKQICRILPGDKSTFEAVGFGSSFLADKPIAGGKANN